ncbi:cohesin domain-containing protein [Roseateles sp. LYH14W]|uniref:Cohesin domain-containing protein n=1 Tax=Pelomonas parva TaxID=3299032 RepID=A0ABW7F9Z7_9BURK
MTDGRANPALAAFRRVVVLVAAVTTLAGCAEQRIRNDSQRALGSGEYEQAMQSLEGGVRAYPDNIALRKELIQSRAEVLTRLVSQAARERAAGQLDEAQATLERAKRMDPRNDRLVALVADLRAERRQDAAQQEAQKLIDAQRPEAALRVIAQALKDNPRHEGLVALQRSVEADLRQRQLRASTAVLVETRPISLDFREASLRTVLDVVSRNSGVNFVLDKDIRPDTRITVYMKQARVEDALDLIVGTNQLAKKVLDAKTIVVYPNTPEKQREYQEQVVRVFYLANSEAKGAAAFLKAMLKVREPFIDERSNMLALRESPENVELAERLVALYDTDEPEVLLEVEVMEVGASRLTDLGISYPDSLSLTPLAPLSSGGGLTVSNLNHLGWNRVGVGISGLIINLKREVGDFTTLANPKIRARNKEKAKVLVGDKIPIITSTSSNTGFVSESVSYLDVGIKLEVEPTVYANDDVAIKVALEVSSVGSAVKTASGTLAYNIGTRNANTVLRLRDGETQLLAGLISREERTSSSRVPGLGDLPVLGRLFSSQQDNHKRTELVLAITPRVLRNARRADASETELWVGTEAFQRLKPVGGGRFTAVPGDKGDGAATSATAATDPAASKGEQAGPPVTLSLSGPNAVAVGDVFDVKLNLKATATLRGLPFEVLFPPGHLQLLDVAEGEYFRRDGSVTGVAKTGESKDGRISVGILRREATGASGEGVVATLKFKAIAAGPTEVRLGSTNPIGLDGPLPATPLPAPLQVQVR